MLALKNTTDAVWVQALSDPPLRVCEYHSRSFIPSIGTFGTVASSTWRDLSKEIISKALGEEGLETPSDIIYDPKKTTGTWEKADALTEAEHLSHDAVILFGLEKEYSSVGSMAELGFMGLSSFLKARHAFAFIKDTETSLGGDVHRARGQLTLDAQYLESLTPRSFDLRANLQDATLASLNAYRSYVNYINSQVTEHTVRVITSSIDLNWQVTVSGTSKNLEHPARVHLLSELQNERLPYTDTYRKDWTLEVYEKNELPIKDSALVNTVILSDASSYGALKDIGIAVARAAIRGSYALIYIDPELHGQNKDFDRGLTLVESHWNKLKQEFPWVEHYVRFADSPESLAKMAKSIMEVHKPTFTSLDFRFLPEG